MMTERGPFRSHSATTRVSRFSTHTVAIAMIAACASSAAAQAGADSPTRAALASERALGGRLTARRTIAVLPFTVTATDTSLVSLGFGLAEFLSDDLAHSHRLMMVERGRLNEMQREERLTASGLVDSTTAVRGGRLVGARTFVIGAIDATDVGRVTIDERAVDVETAAVTMHNTQTSPLESIFRAERDLVMETLAAFGITLTPEEKRSLYERVAPEFRAFLSFSRGVRAETQGNDDLAAASYQEAASLDRRFKLAGARLAVVRARILRAAATSAGVTDAAKRSAGDAAKDADAPAANAKAAGGSPVGGSAPGGSLTSGAAGATAAKAPITGAGATTAATATTPAPAPATDATTSTATPTMARKTNRRPRHVLPKPSPL